MGIKEMISSLKKALDCFGNSPCQHFRKCTGQENKENDPNYRSEALDC